jgi:hypothetical protein
VRRARPAPRERTLAREIQVENDTLRIQRYNRAAETFGDRLVAAFVGCQDLELEGEVRTWGAPPGLSSRARVYGEFMSSRPNLVYMLEPKYNYDELLA